LLYLHIIDSLLGVVALIHILLSLFAEALTRLNVVIRHPNAQHSDNVMSYDNAVSALGKICQFHRESIDATQVHNILLSCFCCAVSVISNLTDSGLPISCHC
jgi:hypothetical protein